MSVSSFFVIQPRRSCGSHAKNEIAGRVWYFNTCAALADVARAWNETLAFFYIFIFRLALECIHFAGGRPPKLFAPMRFVRVFLSLFPRVIGFGGSAPSQLLLLRPAAGNFVQRSRNPLCPKPNSQFRAGANSVSIWYEADVKLRSLLLLFRRSARKKAAAFLRLSYRDSKTFFSPLLWKKDRVPLGIFAPKSIFRQREKFACYLWRSLDAFKVLFVLHSWAIIQWVCSADAICWAPSTLRKLFIFRHK